MIVRSDGKFAGGVLACPPTGDSTVRAGSGSATYRRRRWTRSSRPSSSRAERFRGRRRTSRSAESRWSPTPMRALLPDDASAAAGCARCDERRVRPSRAVARELERAREPRFRGLQGVLQPAVRLRIQRVDGHGADGDYCFIDHHGQRVGGITQRQDERQPSVWLFYIGVPSIAAACRAIEAHGGKVLMGPREAPTGEWIVIRPGRDSDSPVRRAHSRRPLKSAPTRLQPRSRPPGEFTIRGGWLPMERLVSLFTPWASPRNVPFYESGARRF
jgi:hypothetical protein